MYAAKLALSILQNRFRLTPRPLWCTFLVLYRCNARCPMCDSWRLKPGRELNPAQVRSVFRKLGPLQVVRLTGGEPFLRTDFAEIADSVMQESQPQVLHVTTNGSFPDRIRQFATEFSHPRKLQLLVSLDGLEEEHDRSRGPEVTYATAMESILQLLPLRKQGVSVSVNHTISSPTSLHDHAELASRLLPLNVTLHAVIAYAESAMYSIKRVGTQASDLIMQSGYPLHPNLRDCDVVGFVHQRIKDAEKLPRIAERIAKRYYWTGLLSRLNNQSPPKLKPPCTTLRSHIRLLPDGSVPVCQFNTEKVGNLLEQSLHDVWHSDTTRNQRHWVDRCSGCWAECEVVPSALYSADFLVQLAAGKLNPTAHPPGESGRVWSGGKRDL
ncbi:MAG: radical SAM protein [Planctomycetaceae bacterium]